MDKKTLYALTAKVFNTLKKLGIKPKIGVTTGVKRLPGTRNSFNTDLSKLEGGNPEGLKRLIANDADFLPQATPDEIAQYNNNLEYLQSTFPDVFSKPQVVTEAKTGIKTLVDDLNEKLKGKKSMETVNPKTGEVTSPKKPITVAQKYDQDIIKAADEIYPSYDDPKIAADQIVDSYAQMKYGLEDQYGLSNKERMDLYTQAYDYVMDYNRGAIGKTAGESINISDEATAKAFTDFARKNDPEGFKKIQKIVDDINNKNALEEFDIKDREPNAKGGLISGIGTMFKRKR
jgi:hypothetical protein